MTDQNLIEEVKRHFVQAGFIDSTSLMTAICPIPAGTFVMHNSYALMVGYLSESINLLQIKEEMHGFIRKVLLYLENKKGLIVDGYLIILLNQVPDEAAKEVVREVELDTRVCRKHIVWPLADGVSLDRLQFITVLSLPTLLHTNSTNTTFELSAEADALLSAYKRFGNLDRLMSAIKKGELGDADQST
jgi:hypothetical protein